MQGIEVAKTMLGWQEAKDKDKLIAFFKHESHNNDIVVDPSTTAWCACFVNGCERQAGKRGTGKQNARSFLDYGQYIDQKDVQLGDILIFKRGNSDWEGHVTYFEEKFVVQGEVLYKCLGGNQHDCVCYEMKPLGNLIGIRRSI